MDEHTGIINPIWKNRADQGFGPFRRSACEYIEERRVLLGSEKNGENRGKMVGLQ